MHGGNFFAAPQVSFFQALFTSGEKLGLAMAIALEEALFGILGGEGVDAIQPALITARQEAALERALTHLTLAAETRAAGFPIDLMATDVRTALRAIGDVTGENVVDAVLTEIFSRFCIGK